MKRFILSKYGISLNEGRGLNIAIFLRPVKERAFYLRTSKYRIAFGPGVRRDYKGIKRLA